MKQKIFLLAIGVILLSSGIVMLKNVSNYPADSQELLSEEQAQTYQVYNYLPLEVLNSAESRTVYAQFQYEYTPEYMLGVADAVAIVSIISVDSADAKFNQAVGNTYGKMVINNSLYGNLKEGLVIEYLKSGGIMTLEEYNKFQIPAMKEKHERLWEENGIDASTVYVNFHFGSDPNIEEGKTYLCYLKYIESIGRYEIVGLGNGFRELNISKKNSVSSRSINTPEYKILNNNTGEYESLSDYINEYININ